MRGSVRATSTKTEVSAAILAFLNMFILHSSIEPFQGFEDDSGRPGAESLSFALHLPFNCLAARQPGSDRRARTLLEGSKMRGAMEEVWFPPNLALQGK